MVIEWPDIPEGTEYRNWWLADCLNCEGSNIWFDRSVCTCGQMHYYCGDCGLQQDGCAKPEPKPYRVLVTGSRTWTDRVSVWEPLNDVYFDNGERPLVLVHGQCPEGADQLASEWASWMFRHGYKVTQEAHPADWDKHGKSAGFKRNQEMVDLGADICLAFVMPCVKEGCIASRGLPHSSHGAMHCARKASQAKIPVRMIKP